MVRLVDLLFSVLILLSFVSCVTFNSGNGNKELDLVDLKPSEMFELDLSFLKEVESDPPNFIFLIRDPKTGLLREANEDEDPEYAALTSEELAKIEKVLIAKNSLKKIVLEEKDLINLERQKTNLLLELYKYQNQLLKLKQEELSKQESRHFKEKILDRATMVFMFIGGILVSAL